MPLDLLKESYKRITQIKKKKLVHTKNIHETILLLKENIDNYSYDEKKFIKFSDMIKKRDKYRKISIADYMPEIYKVI